MNSKRVSEVVASPKVTHTYKCQENNDEREQIKNNDLVEDLFITASLECDCFRNLEIWVDILALVMLQAYFFNR